MEEATVAKLFARFSCMYHLMQCSDLLFSARYSWETEAERRQTTFQMTHWNSKGKTQHLLEFVHPQNPNTRCNYSFWLVWKSLIEGLLSTVGLMSKPVQLLKWRLFPCLWRSLGVFHLRSEHIYYLHCLFMSVSQLWQVYVAAHSHPKKTVGLLGSWSKQKCFREAGQPPKHNTGLSNLSCSTSGSPKIADRSQLQWDVFQCLS